MAAETDDRLDTTNDGKYTARLQAWSVTVAACVIVVVVVGIKTRFSAH